MPQEGGLLGREVIFISKITSDIGRYGITPEWLLDSLISDRAVRLFATLAAKYAGRDTDKAFPSRTTLALDIGCSVDSIDRAIKELEKVGALSVERRTVGKEKITSVYTLLFAATPSRMVAATLPQRCGIEPESVNQNQLEPESTLSSSAIATEDTSFPK